MEPKRPEDEDIIEERDGYVARRIRQSEHEGEPDATPEQIMRHLEEIEERGVRWE